MTTHAQGWAWPGLSRKAHWFPADDLTSLCGRWLFGGIREDDRHTSPDNCAECKRRHVKQVAA